MRSIVFVLACITGSLFLTSSSCNKAAQCKDAICTMMFTSVGAEVRTADGKPVILDEVYTIRQSNGEKITIDQHKETGRYQILDDSYVKRLLNDKDNFKLTGIKGGKKIVEETYTISADCCHVKKDAGKDVITVPAN